MTQEKKIDSSKNDRNFSAAVTESVCAFNIPFISGKMFVFKLKKVEMHPRILQDMNVRINFHNVFIILIG